MEDRSIVRPIVSLALLSAMKCGYVKFRNDYTDEGRANRDEWKRKRDANLRFYARSRTDMSIEYFQFYLSVFADVLASYYGYREREFSLKYADREVRTYELCFYAVNDRVEDFIYVPPDVQDDAMIDLVRTLTNGHVANFYRYIRRDLINETDSKEVSICPYAPVQSLLDSVPVEFIDADFFDRVCSCNRTLNDESLGSLLSFMRKLLADGKIKEATITYIVNRYHYGFADSGYTRLVSSSCFVDRRKDEIARNRRCAVCLEKGADVKLRHCGHRCYCRYCAFGLWECIVCRYIERTYHMW